MIDRREFLRVGGAIAGCGSGVGLPAVPEAETPAWAAPEFDDPTFELVPSFREAVTFRLSGPTASQSSTRSIAFAPTTASRFSFTTRDREFQAPGPVAVPDGKRLAKGENENDRLIHVYRVG